MTTAAEREAANLSRGLSATYQRANVATAEACICPTAWLGKFVEFSAQGADVYIRFGTSGSVTVDFTTASARTGTTVLAATTSGPHLIIPAGQSKHERVPSTCTHFAHIASAASGSIFGVLSTGTAP